MLLLVIEKEPVKIVGQPKGVLGHVLFGHGRRPWLDPRHTGQIKHLDWLGNASASTKKMVVGLFLDLVPVESQLHII